MIESKGTYRVETAGAAPLRARTARGPAAILVSHGMGQQVPFQTLDDVAEGLLAEDRRRRGGAASPTAVARTVMLGAERLQRLELKMLGDGGAERDVHVYEAYWAPLTEGRITFRDVTGFLIRAAVNGIRLAREPFRRWLFGQDTRFPAPVRTVLYLAVALAVVLSLGLLNALVVAIAAARAPMQSPPSWLNDAFFADLTTILNVLITVFVAFGATILIAMKARQRGVRIWGWLSIATFAAAIWTTIAAAIASILVIAYHARLPAGAESTRVFDRLGGAAAIERFNGVFDTLAFAIIAVGIVWAVFRWGRGIRGAIYKDLVENSPTRAITVRVWNAFLVLVVSLVAVTAWLVWASGVGPGQLRHGLAWPLLVGASAIVRWFLIEFVGDVAAYVQPHVVDRFFHLRQEIKEFVRRTAHAVYSAPEYEDVAFVGHSLGSVVMYDVLNRLILDRDLEGPSVSDVVPRTRLLLTFGSPLDKTAFLFAIQNASDMAGAARRALAASVQPLITDEAVRPPWINVFSPWDLISGSLDYYDRPDRSNRLAIQNVRDPDATTLLAAHVEYWKNPLVFQTIVRSLL
jgi:hypothetical protein